MFARKVEDPTPEVLARVKKSNMQRANYIARQKKIEDMKSAAVVAAKPVKKLRLRAQRRHARRAEALEM